MTIPSRDELLRAIREDELELWYQPKVSFVTGRVCGAEALVRWRREDDRVVSPAEFLPQAEEYGLITEVAKALFPLLCLDHQKLTDAFGHFEVAFNLSARDLESPELVDLVLRAVHTGLVQPEQIQVELTETAVAADDERLRRGLEDLVAAGVALAMDDFGTGYSSLDALHRLPFSVVKIDQGVVQGLRTSGRCAAIVLASIRMAHEMGMKVIAEGVESEEIFDYLLHAGCTEAQGFWISEPLPLPEFIDFVAQGRRWCRLPVGLIRHTELDHLQWRKELMDQVFGSRRAGIAAADERLEISPYRCRFGEWYYGPGRDFSELPAFAALEEPHLEVHGLGLKLLRASRLGLPEETLRDLAERLNACSDRFLRLLQDLEIEALLEECRQDAHRA